MPSVELVDGKWVSVSGVRATDLDAGKPISTPETKKTVEPKVEAEAPKAPKIISKPKTDA